MDKQRVAVIGPGSWGTALSQVLNDNGHQVRIWGNIAEQINEINDEHTNKRYFKDIVLDEKIKAYHDLEEALKDADAVLFVVPTKVTRLVAKQVAQTLDHKVKIMHASKGLEPNTHERISPKRNYAGRNIQYILFVEQLLLQQRYKQENFYLLLTCSMIDHQNHEV